MTPSTRLGNAAQVFERFTGAVHAVLPGPLKRLPETFIGYAVINGSSFALDLLLLSLFFGHLHLPYPVAVSLGYGTACVYSFVINRWLNFRSHGHVGAQSARYVVTMTSNYVIWILGFSWLMEHLGVQFQLARFMAACIEGIYVYVLLRWWVFRNVREVAPAAHPAAAPSQSSLQSSSPLAAVESTGSLQSTGPEPAASSI